MTADVFVPLITPVDDAGTVCRDSVRRLIRSLRQSAGGFVPCLTSGEGWRLTELQWRTMLEVTVDHADGRPVIVGIERPTTAEVLSFAEQAKRLGAAGVMITSPFGEAVDQDGTIRHFEAVHDGVDLDIHIYNETSLSKNETQFETLLAVAGLPRVVGIKDSAEHPRDCTQIEALRGHGLRYFLGWEHHLGMVSPADGCIVSLANVEPALCRVAVSDSGHVASSEVQRLTEAYSLLSEDWYADVKAELFARGVISTSRTLDAGGA